MRLSLGIAYAALFVAVTVSTPVLAVPGPIHQWTFDDGTARDVAGTLDGRLNGNAHVSNGRLVLDGSSDNGRTYMVTPADTVSMMAKTLVSWVSLGTLDQAGGGALAMIDGSEHFDAIVYNELGGQEWIAGSDYYRRTNAGGRTAVMDLNEHMLAITYTAAGTITLYVDGTFYADGGTYAPSTFVDPFYLIGSRLDVSFNNDLLIGSINLASVYDTALSGTDIATLYAQGAEVAAVPEPASLALLGLGLAGVAATRRCRTA